MADLSEKLYTDTPTGSITVNGIEALMALDNVVDCAEDLYKALVNNSDTTKYPPRVTITPVTTKVFRVEVSAQVELTERIKNDYFGEFLSGIDIKTE